MTTSIDYKMLYTFDGKVLLYKNGNFFLSDKDNITCLVSCPLPLVKKLASKVRLINRLLRLEPRSVERLTENKFVVCFFHGIWILDTYNRKIRMVFKNRSGWSDTLNFCSDGKNIYWGEYGNNERRSEVNIYQMNKDEQIRIMYTFPSGTVRHIHNIIFDRDKNCFWILTGDNDAKSGIYQVLNDWGEVKAIKTGKQCFRAVIGFPHKKGLIYATDSVTDENHIYLLSDSNELRDLSTINGSCIYGVETRDYYIFATTVESPEGKGFINLFSYKLGGGIQSRDVHVVAVQKHDLSVRIIARYKKDWLPLKLFQYGSVMFPKGQSQNDNLYYYVMACQHADGKSFSIKLDVSHLS